MMGGKCMNSTRFRKTAVGLAVAAMLAGYLYTAHSARASTRPYLGIRLEAIAPDAGPSGLILSDINRGGPADKAGLKKGDRIVMAAGKATQTYEDLSSVLADRKPGDELELKLVRDGKEQTARLTLGTAPSSTQVAVSPTSGPFLGVLAEPLTAERREQLAVTAEHGVVVTHVLPGSPAATAGLQRDDVITRVGAAEVSTQEQLRDAVHKAGAGTEVTLKVLRGKQELDIKARPQSLPGGAELPEVFRDLPNGQWHLTGPGLLQSLEKLPALEKRVQELEKHVRELEQKLPR
jgi:serine protease Do